MVALQAALTAIASEKPSERNHGIDAIRQIFSRDKTLASLQGDDSTWVTVFQAVFRCVYLERYACERKGRLTDAPTALLNRLAAAGRLLRWLVERSCQYFERKTVKPLVNHLIQTLEVGTSIVQPLALDYTKSLRTVLATSAHRHSIDADQWISITTICFNIVLSNDLKHDLPLPDEAFWSPLAPDNVPAISDRPLGLEDIEVMGCLEELMSSSYAPLVTEQQYGIKILAQYAHFLEAFTSESTAHVATIAGLNHLLRQLQLNESAIMTAFAARAWRYLVRLWSSKSKILKEHLVVTFRILLPHIANATGPSTSSRASPPPRSLIDQKQLKSMLDFLSKQLASDADNRFNIGPLELASLRLAVVSESDDLFQAKTFGAGRSFTAATALSWTTLELAADTVAQLVRCEDKLPVTVPDLNMDLSESEDRPTASGSRKRASRTRAGTESTAPSLARLPPSTATSSPSKKRRLDPAATRTALQSILHSLKLDSGESPAKAQPRRLWALQVVTFLIHRHGSWITGHLLLDIFHHLKALLQDSDVEIQKWALVASAEIATLRAASLSDVIPQIWTLVMRKVTQSSTSRAAALAATAIAKSDFVPKSLLLLELSSLLNELELSAPPFPGDSVCQLFFLAIDHCCNDVVLAKKQYDAKVLTWLFNSWSPTHGLSKGFQSRIQVDELDVFWTYTLITRAIESSARVSFSATCFTMPGSPVVDQVLHEKEVKRVAALLLDAEVNVAAPLHEAETKVVQSVDSTVPTGTQHPGSATMRNAAPHEMRIVRYLCDALAFLCDEWSAHNPDEATFASTATVEQARRSLDLAVLSLLLDATLHSNAVRSDGKLAGFGHKLLEYVAQTMAEVNRWSIAERTSLLCAMHPVVAGSVAVPWEGVRYLLLNAVTPGLRSGLRRDRFISATKTTHSSDTTISSALVLIWRRATTDASDCIIRHLQGCLDVLCEIPTEHEDGTAEEVDDWGKIKQAKLDSTTLMKPADSIGGDRSAVALSAGICVNAIVEIPRIAGGTQPLTQVSKHLIGLLADGNLLAIDRAGLETFRAIASGSLTLSHRSATELMTTLGTEYLPSYEFVKSEHAQLLVLTFLEATMDLWLAPGKGDTDLAARSEEFCLHFSRAVQKTKSMSWKVRVRTAAFFERLLEAVVERDGWKDEEDDIFSASALSSLVFRQAGDPDMRVRFAAASTIARVFQTCPPGQADDFFEIVCAKMLNNPNDLEEMVTRGLTSANTMIVSASARSSAFYVLLEPCMLNRVTDVHASALVAFVAQSLGFASSREMFQVFAAQLTYAWLSNGYDPTQPPHVVLGYSSMRSCLEHTFEGMGAMMAAMSVEQPGFLSQLSGLAKSIRKSEAEGIKECLPSVLAIELIFAVREILQQQQPTSQDAASMAKSALQDMQDRLSRDDRPVASKQTILDTLKFATDRVVVALLMQYWCKDDQDETLLTSLSTTDSLAHEAFQTMKRGAPGTETQVFLHDPPRPNAEGNEVLLALKAIMHSIEGQEQRVVVYHVMHQIFGVLYSERFVNDQLRHLAAFKVFLALNTSCIETDGILLRALLHGCSVLMDQPDLVHATSGLLSWTFGKLTAMTKVQFLSPNVTKVGQAAHNLICSTDSHLAAMGGALFHWYDDQLLGLVKSNATAKDAVVVCCAYPRPFPKALADVLDDKALTLATLTGAIQRHSGASIGPHLLDRLRKVLSAVQRPSEELDTFRGINIWRIFERLSIGDLGDETVEVSRILADIIFTIGGVIKTPSAAQQQAGSGNDKSSMLRSFLARAEKPYGPVQAFVTAQALGIVHQDDLSRGNQAFHRLRAATQGQSEIVSVVDKWPEGMAEELQLLTALGDSGQTTSTQEVASNQNLLGLKVSPAKHHEWICAVSSSLCMKMAKLDASPFYPQISLLTASIPSLASSCLPALLHAVLAAGEEACSTTIKSEVSAFFTRALQTSSVSEEVLSTVINAHLHMRQQPSIQQPEDSLASDDWLSTDYLLLAQRSIACKLYTTALLFVELHREHQPDSFAEQQETISEVLYQVYTHVEDPDSFYGVQTQDVRKALLQRSQHEGDWQKVFKIHSADFESEPTSQTVASVADHAAQRGIGISLHKMGYNRMAALTSNSASGSHDDVDYEVAWRTDDWNLPVPAEPQAGSGAGVLTALKALHRDRDPAAVNVSIGRALCLELNGLRGAGIEAIAQVRRVSRELMCVRQTEIWHTMIRTAGGSDGALAQAESWPDLQHIFEPQDYEAIQSVRRSILRAERRKAQIDQIGDMMDSSTADGVTLESRLLLETSKMARKHDQAQTAMNAITVAERLSGQLSNARLHSEVTTELASVLWAQGEHAIAIQALEEQLAHTTTSAKSPREDNRRAFLLAQMGQWAAVARSQQPQAIDEHFFRPAIALLHKDKKDMAAISHRYACFADEQYRSMGDSSEIAQLEVFIAHRQEEIRQNSEEMERVGSRSTTYKSLNHHRTQAEKILKQDMSSLEQHRSSRATFLEQAVKMYANALTCSEEYDQAVVRLTSLWFENSEDDDFNSSIAECLQGVPVHKFIRLTHQLSSRLSKVSTAGSRSPMRPFHANLFAVMDGMCQLHPFHCLYAIYALRKGDLDTRASSGSSRSSRSSLPSTAQSAQQARGAAAQMLWDKAKASSPHKARIVDFEQACAAYVQWAELDLRSKMPHLFSGGGIKKGPYRFVPGLNLAIKSLPKGVIPVATAAIAVDPTGQYKQMPTIERYSDMFNTAGGLHLPKIIECIATDGKRFKQLFKSNDDLRQDAVMQQVFTLLNELLLRDRRASQRELNIRTYAVIPLGPQCGLLEFVGNTAPIGEVLISTHEKYCKEGEITPGQARNEIAAVMGKTPREKREVFRKVCKAMPPAFHYYFMERFKVPSTWFAVRLNYSRSLATTSIIGHALGLGDRHVSNILLDKISGEMVHIDFGVAFEQGKLLPIPELVPFRLTRDLVDGMGISGVEGVFRRCCEETLRVLRENSDVIKTVLEVFKFDPLWAWTSNPVKVLRAQRTSGTNEEVPPATPGQGTTNTNSRATTPAVGIDGRDTASLSAERAIGSVMAKLSSSLSVQYTVNELIRSATDEGNLSAIFHGWQAAL